MKTKAKEAHSGGRGRRISVSSRSAMFTKGVPGHQSCYIEKPFLEESELPPTPQKAKEAWVCTQLGRQAWGLTSMSLCDKQEWWHVLGIPPPARQPSADYWVSLSSNPVSKKQNKTKQKNKTNSGCVWGTNTEVPLWLPHAPTPNECMCTHRHKCMSMCVRRNTDTHTWGGERGERIKDQLNFCGLIGVSQSILIFDSLRQG